MRAGKEVLRRYLQEIRDQVTIPDWDHVKWRDVERCPYIWSDPEYDEWGKADHARIERILLRRQRLKLMEKVFPSILMVLDLSAATVYFISGDYRRAIYWLAAATLTASITF